MGWLTKIAPAWFWALATAIPVMWGLVDMTVHFHDDITQGQLMKLQLENEVAMCDVLQGPEIRNRLMHTSDVWKACLHTYNKEVPIPWKLAVHRAWSRVWKTVEHMSNRLLQIGIWATCFAVLVFGIVCLLFRDKITWTKLWPAAARHQPQWLHVQTTTLPSPTTKKKEF